MRLLPLALILTLAGCGVGPTKAAYEPRTVRATPVITRLATQVYINDAIDLANLGATIIGAVTLEVGINGNGSTLPRRMACEVAARGGTHFIVVDDSARVDEFELVPARSTTRVDPTTGTATTTHERPVSIRSSRARLRAMAIRIDAEHWAKLPQEMMPIGDPDPDFMCASQ